MNGRCLSFHLFKRVEKKNLLSRIRDYCPSPLSPLSSSSIFSFPSSSSSSSSIFFPSKSTSTIIPYDSISSSSETSTTNSSLTNEELFIHIPSRWTVQEFNDVSAFIREYINNTGTFDETSKTARMIQECHSVIIIEEAKKSDITGNVKTLTPERLVVAAVIISNENELMTYGPNNLSLNEPFENPVKKILVDSIIFNDNVKASKRQVLAMIIIHHLVQLCKMNEITFINAMTNDDTYQYFLDSGFSHHIEEPF